MKPARIARVRRSQASNLAVLALAIGVLLTHLGGAWHFATQKHVRCAEHGEWIDAHADETLGQSTPRSAGPAVGQTTGSAEDDHCIVFLASRIGEVSFPSVAAVSHPSPVVAEPWTAVVDPVESGFALYLLAPKQSPPC